MSADERPDLDAHGDEGSGACDLEPPETCLTQGVGRDRACAHCRSVGWPAHGEALTETARRLTFERMAHYGYTPEQITAAETMTHQAAGCAFEGNRWDCTDEDDKPLHPDWDELEQTAEFIMWVLERLADRPAHGNNEAALRAAADEYVEHDALWNTQYRNGEVVWADKGGLLCRCGWQHGPVYGPGGNNRPWSEFSRHAAEAIVRAALSASAEPERCSATYDHETKTWRDSESGEPVAAEPAWDVLAPESAESEGGEGR